MPAERLYYDDSYLTEWEATVTGSREWNGRPAVSLDRSAFYPESGGQLGDRGTLDGVAVLDTQAGEDGEVWHVLAAPLEARRVRASIDWGRRWDMMQQHLGQHLLSAALDDVSEARTLSAHLGAEVCTVDVDRPELSESELAEVVERANSMVWADVPVLARFVTPEELAALPLRKPPKQVYQRMRVVSVGDFDHMPCGGTHPRRSGEVGAIVPRRTERYKGGLRLEFVCGARAVRDYHAKNRLLLGLAGALNVGYNDLPAAVERLRSSEEAQRKALEQAEARLVAVEAAELLAAAERVDGAPIVVRAFGERSLDSVRLLAKHIADGGGVALLGVRGTKAQLVFQRAAGLPYDMGAALRLAAEHVGGRGGGRHEAAQGGGPDVAALDQALEAARALVTQGTQGTQATRGTG